jgi:hypothetical protein
MQRLKELLEVCEPGCFVALDIDETLQMSRNSDCMLLTAQGIEAYQVRGCKEKERVWMCM